MGYGGEPSYFVGKHRRFSLSWRLAKKVGFGYERGCDSVTMTVGINRAIAKLLSDRALRRKVVRYLLCKIVLLRQADLHKRYRFSLRFAARKVGFGLRRGGDSVDIIQSNRRPTKA